MARIARRRRGPWQAVRLVLLVSASLTLLLAAYCGGDAMAVPIAQASGSSAASACGSSPPTSIAETGGASIALGHASGPGGMTQTVTGAGWPSGEQISLDLDAPLSNGSGEGVMLQGGIASAKVAPNGSFSIPGFLVPLPEGCDGAGVGFHVDFVVHTPDGKYVASAGFVYTAQPAVSLASNTPIPAGALVTLNGSNWEANEAITLIFSVAAPGVQVGPGAPSPATTQPLPNGTITTHADAHGELNIGYTLPNTLVPRSTLLVQATGIGPLYGTVTAPLLQTAVLPAVMPSISLSRSSGTVPDAITVRGANWFPGDTVQVTYCRGQIVLEQGYRCQPDVSELLTTTTVDAQGNFSTIVHLPTDAQLGEITIQALVPNDIFGLTVYAQGEPYTIVAPPPPPLPWDRVHPHLAFALSILKPALPALAIALLLIAAYLWRRRHQRRLRAAQSAHSTQPAQPASNS